MKPIPLLRRDHIAVPLDTPSLAGALDALIELLDRSGSLRDRPALERGLVSDPEHSTVVIARDVALPHFRTDAVTGLVVALGVTTEPVNLSDQRVRVVALVLAPPDSATAYLRAVSALARAFRQEPVITQLLTARSSDDVLGIPELASLAVPPHLVVGDVMVRDVPLTPPETTVRDVVGRFARTGLRALPVVGTKGEVLGVVSEFSGACSSVGCRGASPTRAP
jgi:mannitol/fructose-specific phosphotransferase system IIA component (Ntr-type)